jgi:hypothetical protein
MRLNAVNETLSSMSWETPSMDIRITVDSFFAPTPVDNKQHTTTKIRIIE